jgi:hypothetical protein
MSDWEGCIIETIGLPEPSIESRNEQTRPWHEALSFSKTRDAAESDPSHMLHGRKYTFTFV